MSCHKIHSKITLLTELSKLNVNVRKGSNNILQTKIYVRMDGKPLTSITVNSAARARYWNKIANSSYFCSFCLKCWDKGLDILHKEWPWVEEKEFVSHKNSDAEPAMKSPSLCIFQKECVTQNMTSDFVTKEYRTLLPRTNLYRKNSGQ